MLKKQSILFLLAPMVLVACSGGGDNPSVAKDPLNFTCTQGETDIQYKFYGDDEETSPNLEWSFDKKSENWNKVDVVETNDYDYIKIASLKAGQTIYFRGDNPNGFCHYNYPVGSDTALTFAFTDPDNTKMKISGNIMSLISPKEYEKETSIPCAGCFQALFAEFGGESDKSSCWNVDASELILPATELKEYAYLWLFDGANIVNTPLELPAINAKKGCYEEMFSDCNKLTTAPIIHLNNLEESSCSGMFDCCSELNVNKEGGNQFFVCPKLNGEHCVEDMFWNTKNNLPDPTEGEIYYFN